jgi:hypothetical protein
MHLFPWDNVLLPSPRWGEDGVRGDFAHRNEIECLCISY